MTGSTRESIAWAVWGGGVVVNPPPDAWLDLSSAAEDAMAAHARRAIANKERKAMMEAKVLEHEKSAGLDGLNVADRRVYLRRAADRLCEALDYMAGECNAAFSANVKATVVRLNFGARPADLAGEYSSIVIRAAQGVRELRANPALYYALVDNKERGAKEED